MKRWRHRVIMAAFLTFALLLFGMNVVVLTQSPAAAASSKEEAAAFFQGKTIELVYCGTPGGGYHLWARLIGKYFKKYAGANVVVISKNAAGGAEGIYYTYNIKGSRGLTLLLSRGPSQVLMEAMGFPGFDVRWDSTKFNYIGRITQDVNTFHVNPKKFKGIDDVRKAEELKIGTDSALGSPNVHSTLYLEGLGLTNAKVILGYKGTRERLLAVMQGEIDGSSGSYDSNFRYYKAGQLLPICVLASERYPSAPNVPTIWDLGVIKGAERWIRWSEDIDAVGRPLLAPPAVPKNRVAFLQNVLAKVVADPGFIGEVKKAKLYLDYLPPDKTKKTALNALDLSQDEVRELKHMFSKKWIK